MSIPGLRVPAGFGPWPLVIGCPSPPHVRRRGLGYVASSLGVNRLFRGGLEVVYQGVNRLFGGVNRWFHIYSVIGVTCVSMLFICVSMLLFRGVNRLIRGVNRYFTLAFVSMSSVR